jgi:AcrR family transcriptional regulator
MTKNPDRRSLRSKNAMRQALLSLLADKPFSAIKSEELVAAARLGRSTFYAHCAGKEDLLRCSLRALRAELLAEHERRVRAWSVAQPRRLLAGELIFEHVAAHRHVYPSVSRGRPAEIWRQELSAILSELVQRDLDAFAWRSAIAHELLVRMLAGALFDLVAWWLSSNPGYSVQQLSDAYRELATGVLD